MFRPSARVIQAHWSVTAKVCNLDGFEAPEVARPGPPSERDLTVQRGNFAAAALRVALQQRRLVPSSNGAPAEPAGW